jgi:endonuclease/exonuclease/phosphatase family metal-dependent hydrolase
MWHGINCVFRNPGAISSTSKPEPASSTTAGIDVRTAAPTEGFLFTPAAGTFNPVAGTAAPVALHPHKLSRRQVEKLLSRPEVLSAEERNALEAMRAKFDLSSPAPTPAPTRTPTAAPPRDSVSETVGEIDTLKQYLHQKAHLYQELHKGKQIKSKLEQENRHQADVINKQEKTIELLRKQLKDGRRLRVNPLKMALAVCAALRNCHDCMHQSDSKCAWCASTHKCLPHNVNNAEEDGLLSGKCPVQGWTAHNTAKLTILSLNVHLPALHIKKQGLTPQQVEQKEDEMMAARAQGITGLLLHLKADVGLLQEVEPPLMQSLRSNQTLLDFYSITDLNPHDAPGGLVVLSRYPVVRTSYMEQHSDKEATAERRARVLVAEVKVGSEVLAVATTCFDWRRPASRAAHAGFVFSALSRFPHVVLAGDFNMEEGGEDAALLPLASDASHGAAWRRYRLGGYTDTWRAVNADDAGFTWDPHTNIFAHALAPKSRAARLDRVLVRSTHWAPRKSALVGCGEEDPECERLLTGSREDQQTLLGAMTPVSTHFGILTRLSRFQPSCNLHALKERAEAREGGDAALEGQKKAPKTRKKKRGREVRLSLNPLFDKHRPPRRPRGISKPKRSPHASKLHSQSRRRRQGRRRKGRGADNWDGVSAYGGPMKRADREASGKRRYTAAAHAGRRRTQPLIRLGPAAPEQPTLDGQ